MLLFTISASCQGKNILRGEKLHYDDVLLAMGIVEAYTRVLPISMNITSIEYHRNQSAPHDYVDALLFNEFINGGRRPHLVKLEDTQIRATSGEVIFQDGTHAGAYENGSKRYDF